MPDNRLALPRTGPARPGPFRHLLTLLLCAALLPGCAWFGKDEPEEEDLTAEEIYARAQESMADGDWSQAIEELRSLEARYPYGVYAEQALLDTIYAHYQAGNSGLALSSADRFIKLHPTHRSVDYAHYLKGLASFEEDRTLFGRIMGKADLSDRDSARIYSALTAFEQVYTLFPDSQYAPESRKRAQYLRYALSRSEVGVAKYYYSRGAHVAVVNRARTVLERYSETPAAEDALALMMFSYAQMGMTTLSEDTRRVLELNYPDSEYLSMDAQTATFGERRPDYGESKVLRTGSRWLASFRKLFGGKEE